MVNEDRCQLVTNCFCKRTPTTLESTPPERPSKTFCHQLVHGFFYLHIDKVIHCPVTFTVTNIKGKVAQQFDSVFGMTYFCMELDTIKLRVVSWIEAIGQSLLVPTVSKPSGTLVTKSPWLIHTVCRFGVSLNKTA